MDLKPSSTIGYERRHNEAFKEPDEQRFVDQALAKLGPQPPNFQAVVDMNRGPLVTAGVEVLPLTPRQVEQKRAEGALLVDVRTDLQFDEAHVSDAVCITMLHAGFGTRLAWMADRDQEIVLIGRDDDDAWLAARLAAAVGIRNLGGFLAGGMTSWRVDGREVASIERIRVEDLERRRGQPGLQILDVRERAEWDTGHIPGSHHIPYHDIRGVPDEIEGSAPVAVICGSGERSGVAASMLQHHGARAVIHVAGGGVGTWTRLGLPIEHG